MSPRRVAIIGGGASGCALAWALTRSRGAPDLAVRLLHDEPALGGHSHTVSVAVDGVAVGVDIGVQYVTPTAYPNVFSMLDLPELASRVRAEPVRPVHFAASFTEDINWGAFPAYRQGPLFARMAAPEVRAQAAELGADLARAWRTRVGGRSAFTMKLSEYLDLKPHLRDGDFVRFAFFPILSVFNGYTAWDLLDGTLADLWPLFARFPFVDGPLVHFEQPGQGWYRFAGGATRWIDAMADLARERGAVLSPGCPVRQVRPRAAGGAEVVWEEEGEERAEHFDDVVFTVDMQGVEELLAHEEDPLWERLSAYVGTRHFSTLPGVCIIHTDPAVLSPHTVHLQHEDVQFTGSHAWRPDADNPYGLPYDLHSTYATHIQGHGIPDVPAGLYVTMYAEAQDPFWPDPAHILHRKEWRHGRWLSSYFAAAKARLHEVQGLGGLWFAGNPATFDAEEGALLSAIGMASRMDVGFELPWGGLRGRRRPHGAILRRHFIDGIMFPPHWKRPTP